MKKCDCQFFVGFYKLEKNRGGFLSFGIRDLTTIVLKKWYMQIDTIESNTIEFQTANSIESKSQHSDWSY